MSRTDRGPPVPVVEVAAQRGFDCASASPDGAATLVVTVFKTGQAAVHLADERRAVLASMTREQWEELRQFLNEADGLLKGDEDAERLETEQALFDDELELYNDGF